MPSTPLDTLKTYFQTGDKPTQAQFYAVLDSLRHKDNAIGAADLTTELQNYLNSLSTSNGFVVLAPGTASWDAPAGTLIDTIAFDDDDNPTIDAGTTEGGIEIQEAMQLEDGEFILQQSIRFKSSGTIYFTGVTENTIITIYKR